MQIMPAIETLAPQTANAKHLTEPLHAALTITLRIPQSQVPGPVWMQQYDPEYLQVTGAGLANDYENNQAFWMTFESIKVGQTSLLFVQRLLMIPPLDVRYTYEVNIVEQ
jgi:hypothetical protein